jgi:hypothetical protein
MEKHMRNKQQFVKRFPKIDELKKKMKTRKTRNLNRLFKSFKKQKCASKLQHQQQQQQQQKLNHDDSTLKNNSYSAYAFDSLTDESDLSDIDFESNYGDTSMSSIDSYDLVVSRETKMLVNFSPCKTSSRKSLIPSPARSTREVKYFSVDKPCNQHDDSVFSSTLMSDKTAYNLNVHANNFNDDLADFVFFKQIAKEKFYNLNESRIC